MWLIAEKNCQLMAHPTPLLLVAGCQFCLMKSYPYSAVLWSASAYLSQLLFLVANSHSFACVSIDLSVQGVIYDTSIYQFGGWLGFFFVFFQTAPNLSPAFFIESFTVFDAVQHYSDFKPQLRTQDMTV